MTKMMKKTYLLVTVMLLLMACTGNASHTTQPTEGTALTAASIDHDHSLAADTSEAIPVAPADEWTEDAVAQRVKYIYDQVNRTLVDGEGNYFDLDKKLCTRDWNEVYDKVNKKDANLPAEKRFFLEDMHWTIGLTEPLEPRNITVVLLTGDMADATFELHEKNSDFWMQVKLNLYYEDGAWRIHDMLVGDADVGMWQAMTNFVEK